MQSMSDEEIAFWRILVNQVSRYPQLEPRDLYKLAHQAALGSEHALTDQVGVRRWLERELVEMVLVRMIPSWTRFPRMGRSCASTSALISQQAVIRLSC